MLQLRTAIYCRVSTDTQDNQNQLAELREFAGHKGWLVTKEYLDIVSGSGKKARKEFDAMMEAARRKEFDCILFWKLDRFSREGVRKTLQYLTKLDAWKVCWCSFKEEWFDSCGPFKDAVISIMATLAAQEIAIRSERTKAGLARARREGKILGRPHVDDAHASRQTLWRRRKRSAAAVVGEANCNGMQ